MKCPMLSGSPCPWVRLRMGVMVDTADSAAAALDRLADREYDAIVTDIKMPGMDGLELLAEIRMRRPGTPTLMITGHGENDLVASLERLAALHTAGELSDGEFRSAKARVLAH